VEERKRKRREGRKLARSRMASQKRDQENQKGRREPPVGRSLSAKNEDFVSLSKKEEERRDRERRKTHRT
jgi:hypothetical protein